MQFLDADACVIGAGFAGLTAALRLKQAGLSVVVLEARDRLGGRVYTEYLPDGTAIERGGAWLGPGQDRAYALVAEMGATTYPTWSRGSHVFVKHGVVHRYQGTIPPGINPLQLVNLGLAMARLDRLAKDVPLEAPWQARRAPRWDSRTLQTWIDSNTLGGDGRTLLTRVLTDLFTCDPAEVSLLHALFLIHSHQNLTHLTTIEGGCQQDRVAGGLGALLGRISERLGAGAVQLAAPVRALSQSADGVTAVSTELTVRARRAVVAAPVGLAARIDYDPQLPVDHAQLRQRMPLGAIYKIAVLYESPWWRDEGFTGQSLDADAHFPLTLDGCGATASPGILNLFSAGPVARHLARLQPAERRRIAVDTISQRFGTRAANVIGYVEQDWAAEVWSGGGMFARMGPGVLTQFGYALRAPVGRLHWAGSETATVTHGGIDGAIRSGERAAQEIVVAEQR